MAETNYIVDTARNRKKNGKINKSSGFTDHSSVMQGKFRKAIPKKKYNNIQII